ncbi:MAG TPA: DUF3656 domain-containing protein, partial [Armatimonadota bacterium]|nr:DUF3656 domain-containing protein [Armatimonadota bacterium]
NTAKVTLPCEKVPAEKPERALENLQKQLRKTGGTDFICTDVTLRLSKAYFLPVSTLNALRRDALEKLTATRASNRPIEHGKMLKNGVLYPERRLSYLGNVLNRHAEAFYRRHGVVSIEPAAESGLNMRDKKVMTTKFCLRYQLGMCLKRQSAMTQNKQLFLVDDEGHELELRFDCSHCEMEVYYKR